MSTTTLLPVESPPPPPSPSDGSTLVVVSRGPVVEVVVDASWARAGAANRSRPITAMATTTHRRGHAIAGI